MDKATKAVLATGAISAGLLIGNYLAKGGTVDPEVFKYAVLAPPVTYLGYKYLEKKGK